MSHSPMVEVKIHIKIIIYFHNRVFMRNLISKLMIFIAALFSISTGRCAEVCWNIHDALAERTTCPDGTGNIISSPIGVYVSLSMLYEQGNDPWVEGEIQRLFASYTSIKKKIYAESRSLILKTTAPGVEHTAIFTDPDQQIPHWFHENGIAVGFSKDCVLKNPMVLQFIHKLSIALPWEEKYRKKDMMFKRDNSGREFIVSGFTFKRDLRYLKMGSYEMVALEAGDHFTFLFLKNKKLETTNITHQVVQNFYKKK